MRTKAPLALCLALIAFAAIARAQDAEPSADPAATTDSDSTSDAPGADTPSAAEVPPAEPAVSPEEAKAAKEAARAKKKEAAAAVDAGTPAAAAATAEAPKKKDNREPPKPILTTSLNDAELVAIWNKWRAAVSDLRPTDAEAAQKALLSAKEDLGATDLESFAIGFLRQAETRRKEKDMLGSIILASTAVELAPDLPYAHLGLAEAYFAADPGSVGRYLAEVKLAAKNALGDPRYSRPVFADLASALLLALLATACVVVLVLFLRRSRYFLHDFHHLFPKAAAGWQTGALAILLLAIPMVLRLGVVAELLALFFASCFYLGLLERVVATVLIALVGLVPLAAGWVAGHTAFAGTVAEDVYLLERGGLSAAGAADRVGKRVTDDKADFAELFALGRYEQRRGKLPDAIAHFKLAAARRNNDARLLTNLGNAVLTQGDAEGAAELYTNATNADATLAAAFYDLAKLYYRRAALAPDEILGQEMDRAQTAISTAQRLDEALLTRSDPPPDHLIANRLLISPGLSRDEIDQLAEDTDRSDKIAAQIGSRLVGDLDPTLGALYPGLAALALLGLGGLRRGRGPAKGCDKCGRPVCRRCDPELGIGTSLCNQCVHVFARKGAVPGSIKVRKQIEIRRHQERQSRIAYAFGAFGAGLGHLFSGLTVSGVIYAYVFLVGLAALVLREGVLRAPFGPAPAWMTIAPAATLIAVSYLLSLRGLFTRQAE
jgi:tetratricopeptide (TPR) repeat protein